MPVSGGIFTRIWNFVDQFSSGESIDRADLDVAFDDVQEAINASLSSEAGPVFPSTASGLNATSDTEYFWVASDTSLALYRNVSNVATPQSTLATVSALDAVLDNAEMTGDLDLSAIDNKPQTRADLGLAIGTNVQAYSAILNAMAGLTLEANKAFHATGANTLATHDQTDFGRTLDGSADAAAARTALSVYSQTEGDARYFGDWELIGDAPLYDSGTDGTVATVETPDFEDGYEYEFECVDLGHDSGADRNFQAEFYGATAATYTATANISGNAINPANFLSINFTLTSAGRLSHRHCLHIYGERENSSTGDFVSETAEGIRNTSVNYATAQKLTKLRFSFSAGSIDAGKILMWRRRVS